jgi:hypothetical protein
MEGANNYKNFYQPQSRITSIRRLEGLKAKSERIGQLDYKEMLLGKVKEQYKRLAAQQASLQRNHMLIPNTNDFNPLLKSEATRKYLERKNQEKTRDVQSYLCKIEDEERVKFVSIKSPELATQFKTFNRDRAFERVASGQENRSRSVFKSSIPVPREPAKISTSDLFMCNNDKLAAKLYAPVRQAFADRCPEIVEALLDQILTEEV